MPAKTHHPLDNPNLVFRTWSNREGADHLYVDGRSWTQLLAVKHPGTAWLGVDGGRTDFGEGSLDMFRGGDRNHISREEAIMILFSCRAIPLMHL